MPAAVGLCRRVVPETVKAASAALHLSQRMLRRIGRRDRLRRSDHHHDDRILLPDIDLAAIEAGRHRDAVAFAKNGLVGLAILLDHHLDLAAQHEEHLFRVGMEVHRSLAARRNDHVGQREVLRRDGAGIIGDAGAAGTDEALLRTAILRIEVGLELERIPIVGPVRHARDAGLHPILEAGCFGTIPRPPLGRGGCSRLSRCLGHVNLLLSSFIFEQYVLIIILSLDSKTVNVQNAAPFIDDRSVSS